MIDTAKVWKRADVSVARCTKLRFGANRAGMRVTAARLILGLMGIFASSSAAHAFDLCLLATASTYVNASAVIESAGCSVSSESGTSKRSFSCEGGGWAELQADSPTSLTIVMSGVPTIGADKRCAGKVWAVVRPYDNPLILTALSLGSTRIPDARAVVASIDGQKPYLTWLCTGGGYSCGMVPEGRLQPVLQKYLGDDTLTFSKSEIRVAGLDITSAVKADFDREMTARGAKLITQGGGPLVSKATFGDVNGVPGLTTIEVTYLANRVTSVRYPIPAEADYAGFARSLDERYGGSASTPGKGCTSRRWANGGVAILGEFCGATPTRNGFTFVNTGALDIVNGLSKLVNAPPVTPSRPTAKPRTDMY